MLAILCDHNFLIRRAIPLENGRFHWAKPPAVETEVEGLVIPAGPEQKSGLRKCCDVFDRSRLDLYGEQFRFAFFFFNAAEYPGIVDGRSEEHTSELQSP